MKTNKAYIIRTPHALSMKYSEDAANQCRKLGIDFEFLEWFQGQSEKAWEKVQEIGVNINKKTGNGPAQCCFSAHIYLWKKILDSGEPGIILEHDGMMLHKIDIDIPDDAIIVLGYKVENWTDYNYVKAGPPTNVMNIKDEGHEGSHAYVITPVTAKKLIDEVTAKGATGAIDNVYFLKSRKTKVPIRIMNPTPAIGWIRESTIQRKSSTKNYPFIDSFRLNYTQK